MKKITAFFLAVIMIAALIPSASASVTGRYIVVKDVTSVYASPGINSEKISEVPKNTYLIITEIRNDAFGKAYIAKDGITGWVQLGALELADEPVPDTDITGIRIKSKPQKLSYTDGMEELDLTGLEIVAVCKDNSEKPVSGYNVYAPEMKDPGEKTIKVTYSPDNVNFYSAEFIVNVTRVAVKSIEVIIPPTATYMEHEKLDLSALSVKTVFEDSSRNTVLSFNEICNNPDYIISGCHGEKHEDILQKGKHTFTVSYKYSDIFCTFDIDVTPRKLISLTIKQLPQNMTVYDNKNIPALDGLILEAAYDNGEMEEIKHYDCKAVCDPSKFIIGPGNSVDVYFGELFVTLEFRYSVSVPAKIVIEYPKDENGKVFSLTFLKGEEIDLSGIKLRLVYTDNTYEYVTGFEISEIDYTVMGTQNITVKYKEFSEVFSIFINAAFSKGDITGDGEIKAGDARQALRAAVSLTTLAGKTFFAGDANRDGKITAVDARLILRAAVGLENLYVTL